jgi:hypothetical protein
VFGGNAGFFCSGGLYGGGGTSLTDCSATGCSVALNDGGFLVSSNLVMIGSVKKSIYFGPQVNQLLFVLFRNLGMKMKSVTVTAKSHILRH